MSHVKKWDQICAHKIKIPQIVRVVSHIFTTARSSKWLLDSGLLRTSPTRFVNRLAWRLIVNVNRDFTVDRFAVAECRNEFCAIEIGQGRLAETQKRSE